MNNFNYKLKIQVTSKSNIDTSNLKNLFITQINRRNCTFKIKEKKVTLMWYYNVNDFCYYLDTNYNQDIITSHTNLSKEHIIKIEWFESRIKDFENLNNCKINIVFILEKGNYNFYI